jgi:sulfite reductase (NADPH) flavoprotein alpha-component
VSEQTETHLASAGRELKQGFRGRHLANVILTGPGSEKHTQHHAISLGGAPVSYLPGDALGVRPENDPAVVQRIVELVGGTGGESVPGPHGESMTLRDALTGAYTLSMPSRKLLELMVARGATGLAPLLDLANTSQLKQYLSGRDAHDVLDVLEAHPGVRLDPVEFVGSLRSLLPRLYSIASSLKAHPDEVHVLVVSLTYTLRGRARAGVASTWMNERWSPGATAEMYLQNQQKHFALPDDPSTPIIMVGPGTGVAPFRAFIEERTVTGATGRNWLFFGEQRRASDFFYEGEFSHYVRQGFLRLDTAFSRDQPQKVYVQHRMRERAKDIWAWLEDGAVFFVCGDKDRMAADVDRELHAIVEAVGGRTPDQAKAYIEALRTTRRYKRDVY